MVATVRRGSFLSLSKQAAELDRLLPAKDYVPGQRTDKQQKGIKNNPIQSPHNRPPGFINIPLHHQSDGPPNGAADDEYHQNS